MQAGADEYLTKPLDGEQLVGKADRRFASNFVTPASEERSRPARSQRWWRTR